MDLYTKLAANMEEITCMFSSKMKQYDADLKLLAEEGSHKDIASLSREFRDFKTMIWKTVGIMKSQMELLLLGLDRHETASRKKVLLFHGIPVSDENDAYKTILHTLSDKLKLTDITMDDLASCHRLGSNSSKPRPILVRFTQYKHRTLAWNAKTLLKDTKITVSEFLTKSRHDVFMAARKHFGIRHCWSSEGKIVILLPNNKRCKIEIMSELHTLMAEYPLNEYKSSAQGKVQPSAAPAKNAKTDVKTSRRGAR